MLGDAFQVVRDDFMEAKFNPQLSGRKGAGPGKEVGAFYPRADTLLSLFSRQVVSATP